ncbi:hypothetical protein SAMN05216505_102519 [Streptomyces prasinopilosus]|uniref:Uncharacterized protein n=2 Tax=Streptomyces prasinopilosus TaxID=67344 RepID=A0A1G6MGE9_9ACTN|nr:hypothetical protein SAMN05216505_102519 [Streptomyces prasinopilosus]
MLILLGAAGGALRGLLDAYNRFLNWQSDRRAHRQSPAGQGNEAPRFQEYFDPVADPVAAVVHSAMGAGAAVLFGTTGQVSGAYAAMVVGLSAPVILTQLGRVQSVGDAVNGVPQAGTAAEEGTSAGPPEGAPPAERPAPVDAASQPAVTESAAATVLPTQPSPAVPADPVDVAARRRPDVIGPDSTSPDFATGLRTGMEARALEPNGRPVEPTDGPGDATTDQGALRHQHGPVTGEEGTTR